MLVLTRKVQEVIKVGDNITITIIRVKGQSVRVGIEAPQDVKVLRAELEDRDPPAKVANGSVNQQGKSHAGVAGLHHRTRINRVFGS